MLWFLRDRSAIVQRFSCVDGRGVSAFQFPVVLSHAQDDWNYLCGAAILFGTYFCGCSGRITFIRGNGAVDALTWPTGLESL